MKDVATFLKSPEAKNYKAITKKLVDGRVMLIGFERLNRRSRLYRTKLMLKAPVILDEIVAEHKALVEKTNAVPESQPIPTPASRS